jgi:glycosyltransferase involved in cell wall biosynthesis
MDKLSVVIITYNEERNIGRCIDSVQGVADEIIVLDSFSTDETERICRQKGVAFYQLPFAGYIQQKNKALTFATNDFVLSLDADEAIDARLKEQIAFEKQHFQHDGYYMNRLTNYCGKWIRHGAWYPDRKLRLFNCHKGAWAGVNPHDCYQLATPAKVTFLKGNILHFSYESIQSHVDQFNRFTSLSAIEMHQNGKKSSLVKIYLNPGINFIKGFFLKLGFLDGFYGIMICFFNAFATYIKYVKLRQLNRGLNL